VSLIKFATVILLYGGIATAQTEKPCIIDVIGYSIWALRSNTSDPLFPFVTSNKAGFIDMNGKVVVKPIFMASIFKDEEFHEGVLPVLETSHSFRYIDRQGRQAFPDARVLTR
jgi:hypothetical protein